MSTICAKASALPIIPNGKIEIKADFKEGRMLSCEQFDENGSPKKTIQCGDALRIG